jgi:hypothetical protein
MAPHQHRDGTARRSPEAIPAAIAEILHQLDEGRSLEEIRKQGIFDIGEWRIDILY